LTGDTLDSSEDFFSNLILHFLYIYPVHVYLNQNLKLDDRSIHRCLRLRMNPQGRIQIAGHWKKY
jgi:hypothetical protein